MKKTTILSLVFVVILVMSGCRMQIIPPSLSFNSYNITEEEIEEEVEGSTEIVGYDYKVNAQINVDGSLDGMYFVEVYGDGAELTTYGPVNISGETIDLEEILINSDEDYSKIEVKLYVWKNNLQQTVSQNF